MDKIVKERIDTLRKKYHFPIIVDNNNIPNIIFLATNASWYSGDDIKKDYSVTQLLSPVYKKKLEDMYMEKAEVEASEQLWSMMGSAMHYILEKGAELHPERYEIEKRFTEELFGKKISGQADVIDLHKKSIEDHKYTSVWKYVYKDSPGNSAMFEWAFQLNTYRILAKKSGYDINKLYINLLFRDFDKRRAETAKKTRDVSYPWCQSVQIEIPVVDDNEILTLIKTFVDNHEKAKTMNLEDIEPCNMEERWQDKTKFAVMKQGRKSAVRLLYSYTQAKNYIINNVKKDVQKHYIQERKGVPKRCMNYCAVNKFCPWFKEYQKNNK